MFSQTGHKKLNRLSKPCSRLKKGIILTFLKTFDEVTTFMDTLFGVQQHIKSFYTVALDKHPCSALLPCFNALKSTKFSKEVWVKDLLAPNSWTVSSYVSNCSIPKGIRHKCSATTKPQFVVFEPCQLGLPQSTVSTRPCNELVADSPSNEHCILFPSIKHMPYVDRSPTATP